MKTTLYTVLCVAIRLGAVMMAVDLFERLSSLVAMAESGSGSLGGHHLIGTVLLGLLGFAVAAVLWLWPGFLAMWAGNRARGEVLESSIQAQDLQRIALAVLGAWLAVSGLAGCLGHGLMMLFFHARLRDVASGALPVSEWHWLIHYAVLMLAGSALMLGARGLVDALRRLRGHPTAEASQTGADAGEVI